MNISLRDYFAAHADMGKLDFHSLDAAADLAGIGIPDDPTIEDAIRISAAAVAKIRYIYADAMLEARGRKIVAMRDRHGGFFRIGDDQVDIADSEGNVYPARETDSWDKAYPEDAPHTPVYEDE